MKIKKMYLLILILTVLVIISLHTVVMADSVISDVNYYNPGEVNQSDVGQLATKTVTILNYIRNIGIIASVIMLSIIGMKYILGSLEEKANYKENITIYIIGCLLLMMATTIPSIIYDIMY